MPKQVDYAMIIVNLLSGAALLALLCVLTRVGWAVVRTRATTRQHLLRTARQRLVPTLWVVLFAFAATGAYGEVHSASMGLPNVWEVATAKGYRAYALLGLGAYLSVAQVFLGLGLLTKGAQMASSRRGGGSDLAAALVSTLMVTAALFAVLAMAAVGYVQLLAHSLM
jgi:hypothetical protein